MKHGLFLSVLALFFSPLVWAAELIPGQEYSGPQTLTVSSVGVTFELPEGWVGGIPDGQDFFIMAKQGLDGFVLLSVSDASEPEILTMMGGNIPLEDGVTLVPLDKPKKAGKRITNTYTVSGTEYKGHGVAVIGGHKMSFYAVAVAGTKDLAVAKKTAEKVATGVKFKKPVEEKVAATPKGKGGEWDATVRGKRLLRLQTLNGYSERESFDLCADGRAFRSFNASGTSQLGSGSIHGNRGGSWSVVGNTLTAILDGSTYTFNMAWENQSFQMNGTRWFIQDAQCN